MEVLIPIQTVLTVAVESAERGPDYICTLLGYSKYGIQLSLPQVLNRYYSLPVTAPLRCWYVARGSQLLSFTSYVMGYERTTPACMVIAMPQSVETATRRKTMRIAVELPVGYISEGRELHAEQTHTLDLSLGGVRLQSCRLIPPGTGLTLTLELPGDLLLLTGTVIWSSFRGRRAMAGVQFTNMRPQVEAALAKFLHDLERRGKGPDARA